MKRLLSLIFVLLPLMVSAQTAEVTLKGKVIDAADGYPIIGASVMGWYTEASAQLPARIVKPTPDGTSTVTLTLSYEFDADGYVTKMSWVDENENYAVEYMY